MLKTRLVATATALTLSLLTSAAIAGTTKAGYEAAKASAETAQKAASTAGGEWRDISKFLKEADEAAAKGDFDSAVKLANKAQKQAELGKAQADSESVRDNSRPSYLR
ncbi:MAG: hypothetical protein KDG50_01865 [Chromatiales bacterium]|nr:hypothetical protein [Chromatiales bacterium]